MANKKEHVGPEKTKKKEEKKEEVHVEFLNPGKEEPVEEAPKKKKNSWLGFAFVVSIIIIIFASVIIIGKFSNPSRDALHLANLNNKFTDKNFMFNGYSFVYYDKLWYTRVYRQGVTMDIPFHYNPKEVATVPMDGDFDAFFSHVNDTIYIAFDPVNENLRYVGLSSAEIGYSLRTFGIAGKPACTTNTSAACAGVPILDCQNSTEPIIYLKRSGSSQISAVDNCITISGTEAEMLKAADKFLYKIQGIY